MLRLLTRLVLLFALGFFAPGEAAARVVTCARPSDLSAAKTRVVGECPELAVLRQAAAMQAAETQWGSASHSYEVASIYSLAAERGALAAGDDMVTVYRGVHPRHPDLPSALQGRANPIGGHADAALHNAGNNQSVFTSWTTDRATAFDFAVGKYSGFDEAGGVLLQQRVPRSSLIKSPDAFGEFEVLRSGPVSGATPIIISR